MKKIEGDLLQVAQLGHSIFEKEYQKLMKKK